MRKLLGLMLALALTMTSAVAFASTEINPREKRGITPHDAGLNEVEEGVSPTTGLTLSDIYVPEGSTGMAATGRYLPMMVQICNDDGGVGNRAPWGATYADIVYETFLHKNGTTRLSFIFNDVVPDSIGPVRSARVAHAWIREEWDAAFMFFGQQERSGTNVLEEFRSLGHNPVSDPVLFSGTTGGKPWNDYYYRRSGLVSPYNVDVNAAGIYNLVPDDYQFPNHAYRFTDEAPEGDVATNVEIRWLKGKSGNVFGSDLVYDAASNSYVRYMHYSNKEQYAWKDKDTDENVTFANVIVQFTPTTFETNSAPVQRVIGKKHSAIEGNADFFMGGVHVAGYWKRDSVTSRTVYYGPDGEEISLQRGKTLIVIFPDNDDFGSSVTYSNEL